MHAKTDIELESGYGQIESTSKPEHDSGTPVLVYWSANKTESSAPHSNSWLTYSSQQADFSNALKDACREYPGHDLILLRSDTALPRQLLQRLSLWREQVPDIDAITVLSNAHAAFNPFGLASHLAEPPEEADLDALVANTSEKRLYGVCRWPQHLLWLQADAANKLSQLDRELIDTLPERVGIRMLIADDIFARCNSRALLEPAPKYDWDMPPAYPAEYRQQILQKLLQDQVWKLDWIKPAKLLTSKPVMLHITHSWGGGVARWVEDYCQHDYSHTHLVLQSRGFWKKKQYGTHLTLHQLQPEGPQLAEWSLVPGIYSTEIRNQQYHEILDNIQRSYHIDRVLVSSLIGHSLDALRCPLPTLQVLHDYYPAWPLLSVAPGADAEQVNLAQSLAASNDDQMEFVDRDSRDWQVLTRSWMYHLRHPRVRMVAPTEAAKQQLLAITDDAERVSIDVIGHGLRDWDKHSLLPSVSANDQATPDQARPLRALVLGRLQQGKGRDLLLEALPQLGQSVHITALGCGKEGRGLLGQANVDVIMQYDWQELPQLMQRIQPDIALLLSTVPETFSYTLSELQALNIPVIATRNGSFAERVEHGVNGLLIEPDSQSLANTLTGLAENPIILKQLQQRVQQLQPDSMQQMLEAYEQVWNSIEVPPRPLSSAVRKNNVDSAQLLNHARLSEWRGRALQDTTDKLQKAYRELGVRLKNLRAQGQDLNLMRSERNQLRQGLNHLTQRVQQINLHLQNKEQYLQQTLNQLQHLQHRMDAVVNSRSWKLTKPLRLASRFAYNMKLHGAYNPLRWPRLLRKMQQRLARKGLKTTLRSLQEVPESNASNQYFDEQIARTPVNWPAVSEENAGSLVAPHTHIVLLHQQQVLPLSALLNQLQQVLASQPAQIHLLQDSNDTEITEYLEECEGLNLHTSPKQLGKAIQHAYGNGEISQLLLVDGSIASSAQSLSALLNAAKHRPEAMLISGLQSNSGELLPHPVEAYSRAAIELQPELILLRDTGIDGLMESKFPKQSLNDVLPEIAELIQRYDGVCWQQYNAHYQPLTAETNEEAKEEASEEDNRQAEKIELPVTETMAKPSILLVDAWVPTPDKDSGSLRMVNLLRLLTEMGWHVVFCPMNMRHEGRYTENLQSMGVEVWYLPYLSNFNEFLLSYGQQFQSVILSRHEVAGELLKMVRRHCPETQVIFDTVDLHYLREEREADLEDSLQLKRIAEQTKRQELALINKADLTLVVSQVEQELLATAAPNQRVEVLSNIHDTHGRRNDFEQRSDLLFVGGFQHPPNIDAVRWLCNDIWPLVSEELSEAKLHIIGSKMPDEIAALANDRVIIHGYVEDLKIFHDNCRVSVAPLRYGAGVKGKINSAMSYGLPVVATTCAAEGMSLHHEQQVLIADDAESFAASIIRLYNDKELWHQLSDAGLENVTAYFSMQAARKQLAKVLPDIDQYG